MEQARTHLGTKELRKRHAVLIEGGKIPRAKVMDQHIIDRFLMDGLITLRQHIAAEYLLGQAARAGMWATGVNLSGTGSKSSQPNNVPFGIFPFGSSLSLVRERCSTYHGWVLDRVICREWNVSGDKRNMRCLVEALDCVSDHRSGYYRHPLRHIQSAVVKRMNQKKNAPPKGGEVVGALP